MESIKHNILISNFSIIGYTAMTEIIHVDFVNYLFSGQKRIVVGEEWHKNANSSTFFLCDGNPEILTEICKQYKDHTIISLYPISNLSFSMMNINTMHKSIYLKRYLENLRIICIENNNKIVLFNHTYNHTFSGGISQLHISEYAMIMYVKDNMQMVSEIKNRNGSYNSNINLSPFLNRLTREKKLKRILK